ncbi:hypothetical protein DCS_04032 [Drechmeria coniospora]|uniref:Uncharacterized protein n=1 Tax=Drechmeria coniospora TaxID=98403 RepID=A0A151GIT0_DRECN|nr:hypothetical protein DCS_04032 [Drechmeria coniospora]KYK57025.1 hypothetical protein DCS_04032 [Drechmeria coniospora]
MFANGRPPRARDGCELPLDGGRLCPSPRSRPTATRRSTPKGSRSGCAVADLARLAPSTPLSLDPQEPCANLLQLLLGCTWRLSECVRRY